LSFALAWAGAAPAFAAASSADAATGAASPPAGTWDKLQHLAGPLADPLAGKTEWENRSACRFESALSPGVLFRMKTARLRVFGELAEMGAEGPRFLVLPLRGGAKAVPLGTAVDGADLAASWIVASFQGAKGWEQFDAPWFLSLQKRPKKLVLSAEGLDIDFGGDDTGYVFSMPLYGYFKPPQQGNDVCEKFSLPHRGVRPWQWLQQVPADVVKRCDLWSRLAKAYPVGFQESYSINPATDEITLRNEYRWLTVEDDWKTPPLRFAPLSPGLGLAWKFPGLPAKYSAKIEDPDLMTAFGPYVGAYDADRLDVTMKLLQYTNDLERLDVPDAPTADQAAALKFIRDSMGGKFRDAWRYPYDHGSRNNFVWNIVADVWYGKGIPFVDAATAERARGSLRIYMGDDVLVAHSPHCGKYLLHGPGIGSWGGWGDAGKFSTNALQAIWAFGQYGGGWDMLSQRWGLIRRLFITPEEAGWVLFGRGAVAEMGDEAPPCSSYARMAWAVGDRDEYLFGSYMFARELVIHYVKQYGGQYFYEHQPYAWEKTSATPLRPMPPMVFPTDIWGSTAGWQVDGPIYARQGGGEHQSANRWVRLHDPDTGRFYRDLLAASVRKELDWYTDAAAKDTEGMYGAKGYVKWLKADEAHGLDSLARVRSFVLGEPYEQLRKVAPMENYKGVGGAGGVAIGYAFLRSMVPVKYERLVPATVPASPFVLGLQRRGPEDLTTTAQMISGSAMSFQPRWHAWEMPKAPDGRKDRSRCFGTTAGDFGKKVPGLEGSRWISYGCQVTWADTTDRRDVPSAEEVLTQQEATPLLAIGPFSDANDNEIIEAAYGPEKGFTDDTSFPGLYGTVTWKAAAFGKGRVTDLTKVLFTPEQRERAIAYVQQYVWAPQATEAYLLVGHSGHARAWVNGELVFTRFGDHKGRLEADKDRAACRLKQGWNRVLVKLAADGGDFKAQFRLVGLDRQPIPTLKFATGPGTE
jgi:hypothetical protein